MEMGRNRRKGAEPPPPKYLCIEPRVKVKDESCVELRYDTRCYFNVRSKADMSWLNLPHGDDN